MAELLADWGRIGRDRWGLSLRQDRCGNVLSGLEVVVQRVRIGSARVRMGGIAVVRTGEEHRRQGHASRAVWEAVNWMAAKGCDLSLLFGIRDFYHRFGYTVVFPRSVLFVATADLLKAKRVLPCRGMRKSDAPGVVALYNRLNADRTASVIRSRNWAYFGISADFKDPGRALVAVGRRGGVAGYATYAARHGRFIVSEIGGTGGPAFESLASALSRRASREGAEAVAFHVPSDDAFGAFCSRYGCRWRIEHPRNADAMGRIVDLRALMEKLAPEWNRRLQALPTSWRERLLLETDIGSVGLRVLGRSVLLETKAGRGAATVRLPQNVLTQLVLGYRSVAEVVYDRDVSIPRRILPVLDALFPKGHPYMWWSDRF